jgi:hypothetical protein
MDIFLSRRFPARRGRRLGSHYVQDEDHPEKKDDAHAKCSRGIRSVSIGDSESACFFHVRLRGKLGAAHYALALK